MTTLLPDNLPRQYGWLAQVGTLPRMVTEALDLFGTHELAGSANNAVILGWAAEIGLKREFTADSIPWCGLFAALVAHRAGYQAPAHPLWALNWKGFGTEEHQPVLGDVLVFLREGGGHVGFYIAEDQQAYHVLGGNTGDQVAIARILKKRLVGARAPLYKVGRPESARPYVLTAQGAISNNEA